MNRFNSIIISNTTARLTQVALAVFLTGCSIGPHYEKPEMLMASAYLNAPSQDGEYHIERTTNAWWEAFNDSSLNQLVIDAQQQNIPLKIAAERIKMAQSYQSVVASFKVPTVGVGAGYYNYQISESDPLMGAAVSSTPIPAPVQPMLGQSITLMDQQNDGMFIGANIAWELDLFNRIEKQSKAAGIRKEQAQIYRSGLYTLITADIIHNYLQFRGAEERKNIALSNVKSQKETLKIVKNMVQSGYGSALDLAQARSMLAITESVIPQLELAAQVHKQRIAMLLGESLTQVNIRLDSDQGLPQIKGLIPIGLPSELLKRRPDIRIAEREMAALNEELGAQIADKYPKFFLTGAPGLVAGDFDDLFSSKSFSWVGSVGINWNIFDGGRSDAMVELQQARFDSSALEYQYAVNNAFTEVDSLLYAYGRSQENETRVANAVTEVEIAVDKAHSLYSAGLVDYLSVLDAERQKNMMKDRDVAAKLQTAQVTISVHKALGGDWELNPSKDQ